MEWHKWRPPWHLPADIPALRVELLGRALHPQPQLEAEDGPGALHSSRAPGPQSWWLPSPTLVSLCPVPPVVQPLPPSSLGFFLRKRGRRRPIQTSGVRRGEGAGNAAPASAIFGPGFQKGTPRAQHSHTGAGYLQNISPVPTHSPGQSSITPKAALANIPPTQTRCPVPPPASTPMSHPTALPAPGRGSEEGSPCPHGNTA